MRYITSNKDGRVFRIAHDKAETRTDGGRWVPSSFDVKALESFVALGLYALTDENGDDLKPPAPMQWIDLLPIRSRTSKRAIAIAKRNCSLPLVKSRGAFLQVHDEAGKQLVSSDAICFPMCGKDWKGMVPIIKEKYPKAHTLHLLVIADSAKGHRSFEEGTVKRNTGEASALVHAYCDATTGESFPPAQVL